MSQPQPNIQTRKNMVIGYPKDDELTVEEYRQSMSRRIKDVTKGVAIVEDEIPEGRSYTHFWVTIPAGQKLTTLLRQQHFVAECSSYINHVQSC